MSGAIAPGVYRSEPMSSKAAHVWFGALLTVAAVSRERVRGGRADRCSFDGAAIESIHRVDLMEDDTPRASFCSVACALEWPAAPRRSWWRLRDEVTGLPIDAKRATFVESRVVSVPARHERIHVFQDPTLAMNHCVQFGGARIADPFLPPATEESDQ
jgi:hypothetical protein